MARINDATFAQLERRAQHCVTHSYGCDCREYAAAKAEREVERLRETNDLLREENRLLRELNDAEREHGVLDFALHLTRDSEARKIVKAVAAIQTPGICPACQHSVSRHSDTCAIRQAQKLVSEWEKME